MGPHPDYELIPAVPNFDATPVKPGETANSQSEISNLKSQIPEVPGWPFDSARAMARQQAAAGEALTRSFDLGNGVKLELVCIPGGRFPMETAQSAAVVEVKPFWIARFETMQIASSASSVAGTTAAMEDRHGYQFGRLGYDVNQPDQPAVRVSWEEAMAFCRWLSERTGFGGDDSHRGAMGMGLPRGQRNDLLVWRARRRLLALRQSGRPETRRVRRRHRVGQLFRRAPDGESESLRRLDSPGRPIQRRRLCDRTGGPLPAESVGAARSPRQRRRVDARRRGRAESCARRLVVRPAAAVAMAGSRQFYPPWQRVFNVGFRVVLDPAPATAGHRLHRSHKSRAQCYKANKQDAVECGLFGLALREALDYKSIQT